MKIAIVGAGVSGLTSALLLERAGHEVTVFEAERRLGGHSHTHAVEDPAGPLHVDTGFIVLNDRNYPLFTRLLEELGVASQPSHMSFSVSTGDGAFEYAGTPRGLFADRRRLGDPRFLKMVADLLRFHRRGRALLASGAGEGLSLRDWLEQERFSQWFVERLIVPQASAVWSADPAQMWNFPARFLLQFFENHGMLGLTGRPQWRTVSGGSKEYVAALAGRLRARIRTSAPVVDVARHPDHVAVKAAFAEPEAFDQVVLACHSDQALGVLHDASTREREALGAIPYVRNEAVLHTDSSLLPRRRAAWSSWNFHLLPAQPALSTVTYWMNNLQRLRAEREYLVTLNLTDAIAPEKVICTMEYAHPVFTPEGMQAQARWAEVSGVGRTHFCGAYWRWGFHEDGVWSAHRVAAAIGTAAAGSPVPAHAAQKALA